MQPPPHSATQPPHSLTHAVRDWRPSGPQLAGYTFGPLGIADPSNQHMGRYMEAFKDRVHFALEVDNRPVSYPSGRAEPVVSWTSGWVGLLVQHPSLIVQRVLGCVCGRGGG